MCGLNINAPQWGAAMLNLSPGQIAPGRGFSIQKRAPPTACDNHNHHLNYGLVVSVGNELWLRLSSRFCSSRWFMSDRGVANVDDNQVG